MVQFNFTYDPNISVEQRVGFELAAMVWGSYLTDDISVNLHIACSDSLGKNGQAVGGAIPLFHEQNYGVYQQYAEADATSDTDNEALASQQEGNTVDFLVDGQVVDGNTDILLTSAQAKALGMDEALALKNGGTWDRNLVNANGLDGYILVSNSFDWNYDYTRSGEAPEGTLDFMSMALHEIGHQLGFVSSLDGTLDMNTLHSGETQAEGFSVLDLFRHSINSTQVENPDGAVTDLTLGQNSYFSTDGGETNLANFSDGIDYQASHWKRMQVALGIMDPTLAYTERVSLNHLDLQAMDVLGWDINYNALDNGLDLEALLLLAENKVEASLGLSSTALDSSRGGGEHGDLYSLGYGEWWAIFEKHVLELGYGEWWSIFEMGYSEWQEQFEKDKKDKKDKKSKKGTVGGILDAVEPTVNLELGYGEWWQAFEAHVLELGYGEWWQSFESDMLELGYGEWWQLLELGYGEWWQKLETFFSTLDKVDGNASKKNSKASDGGVTGKDAKIYKGGKHDDIITGDGKQDRIRAGKGDDLVDGKEGHDVIWGEAGKDIIYGQDGNDLIYGGDDNDLLLGEANDDELHGEAGHDIVSGGSGDDIVTGGKGKDDLKGGWGHDVLDGGEGDDRLEGETGNDILFGGEGKDQINGGGGDDVLHGDVYSGTKSLSQLRRQLQAQATVRGESAEKGESSDGTENMQPANTSYGPIRVEAESMILSGGAFIHATWNNDSGDSVKTNGSSTATTTFSGQSGSYMVVVRYFDEIGGDGKLSFGLNGTSLNSFELNQETNRYYTRTIAQNLTLTTGDEFTVTAAGNGEDEAAFDYVEFIPLDSLIETSLEPSSSSSNSVLLTTTNSSEGTATTQARPESTFRVEAESMTLIGDYYTEYNKSASGNRLIAVSDQGEGKALSTFSGESGYYNIVVGYYDESGDGIAKISASLGGTELDDWWLDQALSGDMIASAESFQTRTVASTVFLQTGELFELTGLRGEGYADELARIDYIDFVKVDWVNGDITEINELIESTASTPLIIGDAIRIEAESMSLNGYSREYNNKASSQRLIKANASGTAKTQFAGNSGYYNIVVAYYDEHDGLATLSASLDGVELDEWQLDQNLGSGLVSSNNRVTRTIATQIQVNTGDELTLQGIREYNEYARIDYVEFVPVSAPVAPVSETTNNDFLQGGEGNDTLYGGEGNDTLYGESASDNANSILKGSQTYNGHTYLLSSVGTWAQTQAEAIRLGGNLVTLNDVAEENWIKSTFGTQNKLFIGISDQRVEGQFEWVSGEAVAYTDWAPGQPDDFKGIQDFGAINSRNSQQWDDVNAYVKLLGIIEIDQADNDILVGGSGNDTLYGNAGDDTLYGDEISTSDKGGNTSVSGESQVSGASGVSGSMGLDGLDGSDGLDWLDWLDWLDVLDGSDAIAAGYINTILTEGIKEDTPDGGNDFLYGGVGSDTLEGGAGNDVLDGSDAIAAGYFEKDILGGGLGADTFILGNASQAYYQGGGDLDFATIQDFKATEDFIQLHGSASDYSLQQQGSDTYLYAQTSSSDLVAVIKHVSGSNFSTGFVFV